MERIHSLEKVTVVNKDYFDKIKYRYLATLIVGCPDTSLNHPTVLVSAIDENEARGIIKKIKPNYQIGIIKKVDY